MSETDLPDSTPYPQNLKVARIYMRVSTDEQDLRRQESILETARAQGFYVAGVYREKASGARHDRPELLRMIDDLQRDDVVVAERMDRISRLPLSEAEQLIATIQAKGARLAVPGVVDLSELVASSDGMAKIVLESIQAMLLRLALQMARDAYEDLRKRQKEGIEIAKKEGKFKGRKPDLGLHQRVLAIRQNHTVIETAKLVGCSLSQVKRILKWYTPEFDKVPTDE